MPGPKGWEVFKNLLKLRNDPFTVLEQLQKKYGDLIGVNVLGRNLVILGHPRHVQHVYKDNFKNYLRRGQDFEEIRPVVGNGLLLSEGDLWLKQRRTLSKEFHKDSVERFIPDILSSAELALEKRLKNFGQSVDMYEEFMHLTLEVAAVLFLGTHIENAKVFHDAIEFSGRLAEARIRSGIKVPRGCPMPSHIKAGRKIKAMDQIIYKIIADYQGQSGSRKNVLSRLVDANSRANQEDLMSVHQLRDEVVTMLLAGHETTASTLSWVFYNLALYPEWQEILYQEIEQVLGDSPLTVDSLSKLEKMTAFIYESLRLFPTAANLDRHTQADDIIDGFKIKKDTTVNICIYLLHRHPDFWKEPLKFDPDRFIGDRAKEVHPYAFLPFGKGARACIGELLAIVETQVIVCAFIKKMKFTLNRKGPICMLPRITTIPEGGLPLNFQIRK